jgi:large subunit ribosomal protein L24
MPANIKVGDLVQVIRGNERQAKARGKVLEILPENHRVRVEGVRLIKKHLRRGANAANPDGGIIERPGSVELSNVMLVCPKCSTPTRVGHKKVGDKSVRMCKQCDGQIDELKKAAEKTAEAK